jgi:hypothetical protein
MPDYLLIADTEMYAGNFERPMCAWATGQIGECGVGKELAELSLEDMTPELREWCDDNIYGKPDDHGTNRPVSISPTPGWFNTSGNHFREGTDAEAVREAHNKSVTKYADKKRQTYAHRDDDYGERQAQEWLDLHFDKPAHHDAYLSVEIYLGQKPPDDLLNEMIERIKFFCLEHKPGGAAAGRMGKFTPGPIPLTRVRFVERKVVTTDTSLLTVEA